MNIKSASGTLWWTAPDALDLPQAQAIATRIYVELIRKEAAKLGLTEPTPAAD